VIVVGLIDSTGSYEAKFQYPLARELILYAEIVLPAEGRVDLRIEGLIYKLVFRNSTLTIYLA
jgi:hypothetical protein